MLSTFEVRYDGNDAEKHAIGAAELSESLAGFNRILATAGHFAVTGEFVKKAPAQNVRVFVTAPEAKCFNVPFEIWELAKQHQVFQGLAGAVIAAVVTYVVARAANRNSEMKHLAAALQTALAQNGQRDQAVIDRMLTTIDKMADSLRPSVRQAVAPIGESCATVRIGGEGGITLNAEDKKQINAISESEITSEREFKAVITELDRENATGKARLEGDEDARVPMTITDPAFRIAESTYLKAFVTGQQITLIGKAELSEGDIKRLYVSNSK